MKILFAASPSLIVAGKSALAPNIYCDETVAQAANCELDAISNEVAEYAT
jgi:hypothetical protein